MKRSKDPMKEVMDAFLKDINAKISKNRKRIPGVLSPIIYDAVYSCPEMESVRAGSLRYDFGLDFDPTGKIASAVARAIKPVIGKFKYNNGRVVGNIRIDIQPTDYLNILTIPSSVVVTEKGVELPWLEWLLTYGDTVITSDFGVKYTNGGRSGGAVMVKGFRAFRVDPAFSGTEEDNFISRSLNSKTPQLESALWQSILN